MKGRAIKRVLWGREATGWVRERGELGVNVRERKSREEKGWRRVRERGKKRDWRGTGKGEGL